MEIQEPEETVQRIDTGLGAAGFQGRFNEMADSMNSELQ
jgi:hypothetical protein